MIGVGVGTGVCDGAAAPLLTAAQIFGASLLCEYDASNLASMFTTIAGNTNMVGLNNSVVGRWAEQSAGINNMLAAADDTTRGIFKWDGGSLGVGKPCVSFDGISQVISATFTLNQPAELFAVMNTSSTGGSNHYMDGMAANGMAVYVTGALTDLAMQSGASTIVASNARIDGTRVQIRGLYNGASSLVRYNRGSEIAGTLGVTAPGGITLGRYAGGGFFAAANFHHIVILNAAATAAQRIAFENVLAAKWGTA